MGSNEFLSFPTLKDFSEEGGTKIGRKEEIIQQLKDLSEAFNEQVPNDK